MGKIRTTLSDLVAILWVPQPTASRQAAEPVRFIRVPYDVATIAAAIRGSELPDQFAEDIERGGAPVSAVK